MEKKDYENIINTKWPAEPNLNHPRMLLEQRAKIFLPFAALKGYEESLEITRFNVEESFLQKNGNQNWDDVFDDVTSIE